MAVIFEVSQIFEDKRKEELQKKWETARPYYEKVYKKKLPENLWQTKPDEVNRLFKCMHILPEEEFFHKINSKIKSQSIFIR